MKAPGDCNLSVIATGPSGFNDFLTDHVDRVVDFLPACNALSFSLKLILQIEQNAEKSDFKTQRNADNDNSFGKQVEFQRRVQEGESTTKLYMMLL